MARKGKSSSRRNKIEPSAMTLTFLLDPLAGTRNDFIDLSQVTSLVNRRFYRQGLNWAVAGFKLLTPSGFIGAVKVSKLPNTWTMANAWEKGMRAWMKMNREALQESGSVRPRFLDYKVYANHTHAVAGSANNLMPVSTEAGSTAIAGEWEMSKFVVPDTTSATGGINNYEIIATGSSYQGPGISTLNSVSLIEGYAASRSLPEIRDPNAPDDATDVDGVTPENFLAAVFNEGTQQTDEVLEDLVFENNQAPYPFENGNDPNQFLPTGLPNPNWNLPFADTMYPGGANQLTGLQIHDLEYVTASTIGGTTRLKGGNFPCGLVELEITNSGETGSPVLIVNLIPGTHRGYLAESMTEM